MIKYFKYALIENRDRNDGSFSILDSIRWMFGDKNKKIKNTKADRVAQKLLKTKYDSINKMVKNDKILNEIYIILFG